MPEIMKYVARPCLVVWFEFQGFTDPYYRHLLSKKLPMRHKQAMHLQIQASETYPPIAYFVSYNRDKGYLKLHYYF